MSRKQSRKAIIRNLLVLVLFAACTVVKLASGYAWCSQYWNWDGRRRARDGQRWPAGDGVVITYINGIFHSVPEWESITAQLQALFGHEVRPFYNPSSGWWITDASKAGYHLLRRPANDTIAHALGEHLAQAVDDVGRGRVLHIAHSGGAMITYLAAQHHLTRRQRDKIDVLTFGAARSITRKYFNGRVVNYYARNDPLVKLDRRAAEMMKLTNDSGFQQMNEKHNTTFVFLEGRAGNFVQDHSLEGPTYRHALKKEAKAFRRDHFGPLSPLAWDYETSILRLARKQIAQLSGIHAFFSPENLGVRALRKSWARFTGYHGFFSGKSSTVSRPELTSIEDAVRESPEAQRPLRGVSSWARRLGLSRDVGKSEADGIGLITKDKCQDEVDRPEAQGGERTVWTWRWWPARGNRDPRETGVEVVSVAPVDKETSAAGQTVADKPNEKLQGLGIRAWFNRSPAAPASPNPDPTSSDSEDDHPTEEKTREEQSSSVPNRPWLAVGWTPWGTSRLSNGSATSVDLTNENSTAGQANHVQTGVPVTDRSDDQATDALEEQFDLQERSQTEDAKSEQLPSASKATEAWSVLQRWWPTTSARQEVPDQPDVTSNPSKKSPRLESSQPDPRANGANSEPEEVSAQSNEDLRSDLSGNGEGTLKVANESSVVSEQAFLQRWWPNGKGLLPSSPLRLVSEREADAKIVESSQQDVNEPKALSQESTSSVPMASSGPESLSQESVDSGVGQINSDALPSVGSVSSSRYDERQESSSLMSRVRLSISAALESWSKGSTSNTGDSPSDGDTFVEMELSGNVGPSSSDEVFEIEGTWLAHGALDATGNACKDARSDGLDSNAKMSLTASEYDVESWSGGDAIQGDDGISRGEEPGEGGDAVAQSNEHANRRARGVSAIHPKKSTKWLPAEESEREGHGEADVSEDEIGPDDAYR